MLIQHGRPSPEKWVFTEERRPVKKLKLKKTSKNVILILILCVLSYALHHRWEMIIAAELRIPVRWAAQRVRDQIIDYLFNKLLQWISEKANEYRTDKWKSKLKNSIIKKPSRFKAKKNIK